MFKSVILWFLAWWQVRPLMANLCATREGLHHYRQQGQHLSAALTAPVTYLSDMAGNNCSAGSWEARENPEEPCGPALALLHSGKRQRGHCRVWLAIPRSALANGQIAMPVLDGQLWFQTSGQSWIPARAKSALGSVLRTVCLFFKLSPLTLGECRITPWKAEGSGISAVSVGLARVLLTSLPNTGCAESGSLGCCTCTLYWAVTQSSRGQCSEIPVWCTTSLRENMYTAPCKALYFISCLPSYLPFQVILWTWILPLICQEETWVHFSCISLLTPYCSRSLSL